MTTSWSTGNCTVTRQQRKIMISSTARDLPDHREIAMNACLTREMLPKMMEHLVASDTRAIRASLDLVDACDYYLGIIAYRYGYVPEGHERSITEMEYDRAVEKEKPRLMFLMSDKHKLNIRDVETASPGAAKLAELRERIEGERLLKFFNSPEHLVHPPIAGPCYNLPVPAEDHFPSAGFL